MACRLGFNVDRVEIVAVAGYVTERLEAHLRGSAIDDPAHAPCVLVLHVTHDTVGQTLHDLQLCSDIEVTWDQRKLHVWEL